MAADRTGDRGGDLLGQASWFCCATAPGAVAEPSELDKLPLEWMAAAVPGTAAAAVVAASGWRYALTVDFDASDWWFRCRVPVGGQGRWRLRLEGLATVADVWFAGRLVVHSENMFVPAGVDLEAVADGDELVVRCAALAPLLAAKRPRPRWKTQMIDHQALRWFRTSYIGRQPGWVEVPHAVGPWRPVRLEPASTPQVVERRVGAFCDDDDNGVVSVTVRIAGGPEADVVRSDRETQSARLRVSRVDAGAGADGGAAVEGPLRLRREGDEYVVDGGLALTGVARWWPHTHGDQPLYAVTVMVGDTAVALGRVGFRSVVLRREHGAFTVSVNGVDIFCRGAGWWPVDAVGLHAGDEELDRTLALVVEGHMNMVRLPGGTVYEDGRFWDRCDELGIMVWQDCMLAFTDPPVDEGFEAAVVTELEQVLGGLGGRPSLTILCGSQEIEEQAAMNGLDRTKWSFPLLQETIPALAAALVPGVPYVPSSPTGGDMPFQADRGDCHYWGLSSYLRSPDDARRAGLRFMSEGLGQAVPPERSTVDEDWGGALGAGHDRRWKQAVHHDTGRSWDLEDVRDFYVGELFGVDPHLLRYLDPDRALDLGRAATAELFSRALAEWRRPGSPCAGALTVALRDLVPGAGWGLIDARGRPKAPWFTIRRVVAPVAVLVTDEGLNGLHLHLMNDRDTVFRGRVTVELFARGQVRVEEGGRAVEIPARGALVLEAGALFDGFRDLSYAYRFGPPAYDVVAVALHDDEGRMTSDHVHLPAGLERPLETEVGLEATARPAGSGAWTMTVSTRRFAQWVVIEVPGFRPSDSWFHLPPGAVRTLTLFPEKTLSPEGPAAVGSAPAGSAPAGVVRALNAQSPGRLVVERW